jgi:hypothetical protein
MNKLSCRPSLLVLSLGLPLAAAGCFKVDDPPVGEGETAGDPSGDGDPTGDGDPSTGDGDPTTGDGDGDGDGDDPSGDGDPIMDYPEGAKCDPWFQNCPPGQKCVPYASTGGAWDDNKCVSIKGDGAPGDACISDGIVEGTDTCDATSICWSTMNVDGELHGVCTPFCEGTVTNPECRRGTSCTISNNGSLTLCIDGCNPLLQNCPRGEGCFWFDADSFFGCAFTTQDIPSGEPCGYINDCAAGNICTNPAHTPDCLGSACCVSFCSLFMPYCPVAGTECVAFFGEGQAPAGYENTGVCIVQP